MKPLSDVVKWVYLADDCALAGVRNLRINDASMRMTRIFSPKGNPLAQNHVRENLFLPSNSIPKSGEVSEKNVGEGRNLAFSA